VLLGAFARVDVEAAATGAVFLTFYVAPGVTLHATDTAKLADGAFVRSHVGALLSPPFDEARLDDLGATSDVAISVDGRDGLGQAALDVNLSGLGWVAVSASGPVNLRVRAPESVLVTTRAPLLPFEKLRATAAKFTGGKLVRTGAAKGKKRKNRKAPGRKKRG